MIKYGTRHAKWIRTALKLANKNKIKNYKHCSLLVRGGKIISIGINKNKAGCLGDSCYGLKGWHSELDCLHKLDRDLVKGSILYVAGLSKSGRVILSKPCKYCEKYLSQFDLKAIYFSTPDGNFSMM